MLYQLRKISREQKFMILAFVLSILLSFMFGYVLFRYVELDLCKTPAKVGDADTFKI